MRSALSAPSGTTEIGASSGPEPPNHAPTDSHRPLPRGTPDPMTLGDGNDASTTAMARPSSCEPLCGSHGPPSPQPGPGNSRSATDNSPNESSPVHGLQGSGASVARDASPPCLSNDLLPCGQEPLPIPDDGLPYDLGHDNSPSITDEQEARGADLPAPGGRTTVCERCGEVLPDSAAIDVHIGMHHPPPGSPSPSRSPSPLSGSAPPPAAAEPSPSPTPDPVFPYACSMCRARYKTERGLKAHIARLGHYLPLDATVPERIGVPSGSPSPELLRLLTDVFTEMAGRLPPVEALARFLSTCRRMEGSGRLPPAQSLLRKGLLGRAWQALLSETSSAARVPEPQGKEREAIVHELHPRPMPVSLPPVHHVLGPSPKITAKALLKELQAMRPVAAGPSGLGKPHLLHLCGAAGAAELFTSVLTTLFSSRNWAQLQPLCEFRLKLLPKSGGRWRPIAVQETLLVAFHRLLLRRTPALRKLPAWQLAFEHLAQMKAIRAAEELKRTHHLLTVDVRNAFNSVPHSVILFALRRAGVVQPTVAYIESFLAARHSSDLPAVPAGVPQGDPLSMAMFCQSLVWPVETYLGQYKVVAYADDLVIASEEAIPIDTVKSDAQSALSRIGLTVELSKCSSTQAGAISFMGTRVLKHSSFNLAQTSARRLHEHLAVLRASGLSLHDRLRLLSACVVPAVNYGPLVDDYPGPSPYADVDAQIVEEVATLLEIPEPLAKTLALTPRAKYGLGLVLPHHYYDEMHRQRQDMKAGVFRELRKKRLQDTAALRSFLPLALLGCAPLDNTQVLFIGDCLAGRYQRGRPMGTCCHCKQPFLPRHHLVCKAINGIHVARHDKILDALLACSRGRAGSVVRNPTIPVDHLQPDLVIGGGFGDLVVTVPWRLERSYALKAAKYRPLVLQGRAAHILPVVVGADGVLHHLSAAGLAFAGVDLARFMQEAAQVILWHYRLSALLYAGLRVERPVHRPAPAVSLPEPAPNEARATPPTPLTPAMWSPGTSPSVEIMADLSQHPDAAVPPPWGPAEVSSSITWGTDHPAQPDANERPDPFMCSRAPSPPPLDDDSPDDAGAPEPVHKALPSFFKRVGPPKPHAPDGFYPFKRIDTGR
ncbi:putative Reverse transcriptase/endonuclease [Giardia duodenalis]|uniref:Reverse transcriptase/endonuclease n=4 Tax=Giardia intestinalis TaxID=5741 RepID=E2RU92_GIAIC|nr:putative Reverse transcriptase/endonuclease [Giardia intestinalis]XP_037901527.1 putative Reverse transcriptase/endonuclease [Giardia intestinalis]XP_037901528.1 putative Reverse transcriptase/endonuclease [Giardia intestinalis]XP_037901529.1 putative Reverse transcriptase/endonuclease [Giardia intestinalis]XP_037902121.1 putative Reverse transcriptase/endonuclease [Giardia intestinalis]XP_037902393.1 putative Reverse transcriptase/endonuclease [Giardia intestinalis]AAL28124.1 reverse tran|eukprot:XP_001708434.1 Reverse transcriptase/endonuclease, putative [Giardia lamblia ATCC 50803]